MVIFFFASRRRNTRWPRNWSSDVCSSDLQVRVAVEPQLGAPLRSRGMAASLDQRGADTPARMCPSHRELVQIRSEEHTSELQSRGHLVCRLLLEKKKLTRKRPHVKPMALARILESAS